MTASAKPGAQPLQMRHLMEAFRNTGRRGLVQYRTFLHADVREGTGFFVDMTHLNVPNHAGNCEQFEFSRVKGIAVGAVLSGDPRFQVAARVGSEIYVYRIGKIDDSGFLEKKIWVMPTPSDFQAFFASFEPVAGAPLHYKTAAGELRKLPMENAVQLPSRAMQPTAASGG